ncbi:MAG: tRNA 2-thiouridine(34) synthase MnmA [Nitrospirae bacterium]|nr:tRNA 2-thiouridine(34) synthase MnmA [Nitrospirota bacterium]
MQNKKVLVGMSGGIDSSVTAMLLKKQGFDVIGATLKIWEEGEYLDGEWHERSCCKIGLARFAAENLKIPYYVWDAYKEFKKSVVDDFCSEYLRGRTPNPCIRCNEMVKFSILLENAVGIGADYVATGHYARIVYSSEDKKYHLKKGLDTEKDQSYFLYRLSQGQLSKIRFPLGELTKKEVSEMAESLDLPVDEIKESQEVCFVTQEGYQEFISNRIPESMSPGNFVSSSGEVLGQHKGVAFYTIGQRKGLGVAAGERLYVTQIDTGKNEIVLGTRDDLSATGLIARNIHIISGEPFTQPKKLFAKIRYRNTPVPVLVRPVDGEGVEVVFENPQQAITPGQSIVFYDNDEVIGGGIIV